MKDDIESIEFKPADGGLVSETRRKLGNNMDYDSRRKTAIHPTLEHAARHLSKHLGGKFSKGSAASLKHK